MEKEFAGRHLILDVVVYDSNRINDLSIFNEFFYRATEATGMTMVFPPVIAKFPFSTEVTHLIDKLEQEGTNSPVIEDFSDKIRRRDQSDVGVSGIALWLESHLSAHSWSEKNYISIDLFSCKNFDINPLVDLTRDIFGIKEASILNVERYIGDMAKVERSYESNF